MLVQIVDKERLGGLDVLPGFEVGEPVGVETDEGVDDRPALNIQMGTFSLTSQ